MIWIILILAITLRLVKIDQSLWLDEAINVIASQNYSFWDMVTKYPVGDFHPPLYFAILWLWVKIWGIEEIWVRLPSVIFGVTTVWLVYLLGKEMFNKKVALLGGLLMALGPLHIYYSQEARMYSLAAFSATLSFYFFWRLIHSGNWANMVGYGISNILVLYSDYLVYLIIPVQVIFLLLFQKNSFKKILFPLGLALVTILPWLTIFPKQLSTGTAAAATLPGWANVVGGANLKELFLIPIKTFFGRVSIENKQIYGLASGIVGIFYGIVIWNALKKIDSGTKLLILWILVPVILAFLISFFIPVLSYFRMLFILPPFYLLLAKGIDLIDSKILWKLAIFGVCAISMVSLIGYYTNPKFQREDWRGAVGKIDELSSLGGIIIFENNNLPAPFIYYSKNISPATGGLTKIPAKEESDINEFPGVENIYLFEYLVDITDPKRLLEKSIQNRGYKELEILNFNGVGFVKHYQLE